MHLNSRFIKAPQIRMEDCFIPLILSLPLRLQLMLVFTISVVCVLLWSTFKCFSLWLLQVSTDGLQRSKHLKASSSKGGSYLYISITNKVYNMDESLSVTFNTINGPSNGYIYYLVSISNINQILKSDTEKTHISMWKGNEFRLMSFFISPTSLLFTKH